jgi:hypothetical protein
MNQQWVCPKCDKKIITLPLKEAPHHRCNPAAAGTFHKFVQIAA